jgi:L,D-peptidoglycan transpeptidase YkuD (ErfK/YbiS/YcfS/YnhG family)
MTVSLIFGRMALKGQLGSRFTVLRGSTAMMFEMMHQMSDALQTIYVRASALDRRKGRLFGEGISMPCALGRSGIRTAKREGDGATPRAVLPLRRVWWRGDRLKLPGTGLPMVRTAPDDLWCDAPDDRRYNRPVTAPCTASHEAMWREDGLYDVVVELGWNDDPPIKGRGSAIFMHIARPGFLPTEGCVALRRRDMLRLLPRLGPNTRLRVGL